MITSAAAGAGMWVGWLAVGAASSVLFDVQSQAWFLVWLTPLVAAAAIGLARCPRSLIEGPVLISAGLAVVASMVMATPFVPEGQVDPGVVYETRIPNRPADNRLPYRTGQFILNHLDPVETRYFLDWALTDRTQLSAAAASTVVGALGVEIPSDELWYRSAQEVLWDDVDDFGYWSFRAVLIAFSALLPLGVAALAATWFTTSGATVAAAVAGIGVFTLVETMFTWPKYLAVALACTGLGMLMGRRPAIGGVLLGLGYMAHPVGLLMLAPALVLGLAGRSRRWQSLGAFLAVAFVVVIPWVVWTSLILGQTSRMALYPLGWVLTPGAGLADELGLAWSAFVDGFPGDVLKVRWISLRDSLNPIGFVEALGSAQPRVRLFTVYDRTIPGMVGLTALLPLVVGLLRAARVKTGLVAATLATLAAALGMWGVWPRALGADTLQPLVPFLALAVSVGLAAQPVLRWLILLMALESFVVVDFTLFYGADGLWRASLATATYATFLAASTVMALNALRFPGTRPPESRSPVAGVRSPVRTEDDRREEP